MLCFASSKICFFSSELIIIKIFLTHKNADKFNVNLSLEVKLMGFNENETEGLC